MYNKDKINNLIDNLDGTSVSKLYLITVKKSYEENKAVFHKEEPAKRMLEDYSIEKGAEVIYKNNVIDVEKTSISLANELESTDKKNKNKDELVNLIIESFSKEDLEKTFGDVEIEDSFSIDGR